MKMENGNTQISAPELIALDKALGVFRSFKRSPFLTVEDLVEFLSMPSSDRDDFLNSNFTPNFSLVTDRFAKQVFK